MNVDKKVLNEIRFMTEEERKQLMKIFDLTKHEPNTMLVMAIFRDILIYKHSANALLLDMKLRIAELESRLEEIERKKRR